MKRPSVRTSASALVTCLSSVICFVFVSVDSSAIVLAFGLLFTLLADGQETLRRELFQEREHYLSRAERDGWLNAISDSLLRSVGDEVLEVSRGAIECMYSPFRIFNGETAYLLALTEKFRTLSAGSTVLAVCAKKRWGNDALSAYFIENFRAVARGVRVIRIFYLLQPEAEVEARLQLDHGIDAYIVTKQVLQELADRHKIPPDVGLTVFSDGTVLVHRGSGKDAVAYLIQNDLIAQIVRRRFEPVLLHARKPGEPNIGTAA